ncbi:MFS transporter [Nakamurella leprariae]|uniref:MFS transporter n=1 Tax=Nakamurella leprariae TaxID=2803911 RepID=A0A939BY63_9ACTN|nr:MFS transporter [Nakamurella leprariae]MBM9466750.1 MFS transporter [Nakamurella leprariae]
MRTADDGAGAGTFDPERDRRRGWVATVVVGFGAFVLAASQLMPVALIAQVATDLDVSDGISGLMIAVPAVTAALTAFTLTVPLQHVDRRWLLVGFAVLFTVSDAIAAVSPHIAVLLAARVLLGVALGGFWAIAASMAPRLVPTRDVGMATATVFGGIALATAVGVPAGAFLASWSNWRVAIGVMAALGLLAAVLQLVAVPSLPEHRLRPRPPLGQVLRRRSLWTVAVVSLLMFTGQFSAYTYLQPTLRDEFGVAPGDIGGLLLAFGIGAVIGNFTAGPLAQRFIGLTICGVCTLSLLGILALRLPLPVPVALGAALVVWGMGLGSTAAVLSIWNMRVSGDHLEAGAAVFIGVTQGSIALGAAIGGRWVDGFGTPAAAWFGAALFAVALGLLVAVWWPRPGPRADAAPAGVSPAGPAARARPSRRPSGSA